MSDRISDVAGWVFAQDPLAYELLFPEPGQAITGLSDAEREALAGARPHVEQTIGAVLVAVLDALTALAADDPVGPHLRATRRRPDKAGSKRNVVAKLVPGRVQAGVALDTWGEPGWHLWLYSLIEPAHHARAHAAVAARLAAADLPGLTRDEEAVAFRVNDLGNVVVGFRPPRADEEIAAYAAEAAKELWSFAGPIAAAVRG